MKNKIKYLIITIITLLVLSGCGTSADTVRYNLSREDVSRYDYEFVFRPEAIIPVEIKTQVGEN